MATKAHAVRIKHDRIVIFSYLRVGADTARPVLRIASIGLFRVILAPKSPTRKDLVITFDDIFNPVPKREKQAETALSIGQKTTPAEWTGAALLIHLV